MGHCVLVLAIGALLVTLVQGTIVVYICRDGGE